MTKRGIFRGMFLAAVATASAALVSIACSSSDSSSPSDAGADVHTPPPMPPLPPDEPADSGGGFQFTVNDVNGKGMSTVQACIVDHPEIPCVTTGPTGIGRMQTPLPSDNFTFGIITAQAKAAYPIDGAKLATLLAKPGVNVVFVYAPITVVDGGGAQDPAKGSVLVGQIGITAEPLVRQFGAEITTAASGGTELDDVHFVAFENVAPGPVTVHVAGLPADAGPDADAAADAASSTVCGTVGTGAFAWDTTADPSKMSGRVYAGYTIIFATTCM